MKSVTLARLKGEKDYHNSRLGNSKRPVAITLSGPKVV